MSTSTPGELSPHRENPRGDYGNFAPVGHMGYILLSQYKFYKISQREAGMLRIHFIEGFTFKGYPHKFVQMNNKVNSAFFLYEIDPQRSGYFYLIRKRNIFIGWEDLGGIENPDDFVERLPAYIPSIYVVRQGNPIKTWFFLLHEFGHYLIYLLGNKLRYHEIYDKYSWRI